MNNKLTYAEMNFALNCNSWTRTGFDESLKSLNLELVQEPLSDSARQILRSRASHGANDQESVFSSINPVDCVTELMGNEESMSDMCKHFDLPLLSKVGPQGASFPAPYMWEKTYKHYYEVAGRKLSRKSKWLKDAIAYVAKDLKQRLTRRGLLQPLTWEQSVMKVTSKDTQSWPFGGSKSDPETVTYLLSHPGERGGTVLAGQRYQRNKHDAELNPIPRGTFNSDVRDVVFDTQFEAVVMEAMQHDAFVDPYSPFAGSNGPDWVGKRIYDWAENRPMPYISVMGDVKGMDTWMTRDKMEIVFECLKGCFDESVWSDLRESLLHGCEDVLVIDEEHQIRGEHSIFSGVVWTHVSENIISYIACIAFVATGEVETEASRTYTLEYWKPALIHVEGDDVHILLAIPQKYAFKSDFVGVRSFQEQFVYIYEHMALCAELTKQDIYLNATSFCSKRYSVRVKGNYRGENTYKPVYSPVMAINATLFPEYPLEDNSVSNQLVRFCQVWDQVYGHERYERCVKYFVSRINTPEMRALVAHMTFSTDGTSSFIGGTWTTYHVEWEPESSPTLLMLRREFGYYDSDQVLHRYIQTHAAALRREAWLLQIDLSNAVFGPTFVDERCRLRDALAGPISDKDLEDTYWRIPMRTPEEFNPLLTMDQLVLSDHPMSDYRSTKQITKELNRQANQSINPKKDSTPRTKGTRRF